jgi:spermidine synthase
MTKLEQAERPAKQSVGRSPAESSRSLAVILPLFAGSGCAALIYEVVWLQQLQLIIGSTAVSVGVLLATYMGGLFLGSVALPRLLPPAAPPFRLYGPFRVYGMLELGIGLLGILNLFVLPYVGSLYVAGVAGGFLNLLLRGVLCALCLLPPTILMGATFPVLCRSLESTRAGASRMGWLYGTNIGGAVFGCLWAGFYLLRLYGLAAATYAAVAINILIGLASIALAGQAGRYESERYATTSEEWRTVRGATYIYVAIALSGLTALGAQVVWTRLLSVLLGTTVYTFSIILAVFLAGMGIGSGAGSILARSTERPKLAFGICQLLLAASIAWTAWAIAKSLPYWPIDPALAENPVYLFQLNLFRALWTILPATIFWGASFPLALGSLAGRSNDSGRLAAGVYGANTLGAILGALFFSFISIPALGTMRSQQILIGLAGVSAIALLAPLPLRSSSADELHPDPAPSRQFTLQLGAAVLVILALIASVSNVPWQLLAYGRRVALMSYSDREESKDHPIQLLYRGEGLNSSIVITNQTGLRIIYVNGNVEASNAIDDMRLQTMDGQLPALVNSDPQDVLVVGFGTGVSAGTFVTHPETKTITIAELERLIPPASGKFFQRENNDVLNDPRTKVFYDDGRHYLQTHNDRFDVITSDPVHLWIKGTSALYSKEYFEIVRRHLKPGGVAAQWLPLYDGNVDTIKSVLATFFEVFPNGTVWSNHIMDRGFDLVLLGQNSATKINIDALQQRLDRPDYARVTSSLRAVGFNSADDVLATYLGQASDLKPWLAGAQINLDRNLRLQYLAGLEMNANASAAIYQTLLGYRVFPQGLFEGSPDSLQRLSLMLSPVH